MEREHALDRGLDVIEVVAVDQNLALCIGRERQLVDRYEREGDRVRDEQLVPLPALDLADLALERVAMVQRLLERVLYVLVRLAPLRPKPLAMPALDPS